MHTRPFVVVRFACAAVIVILDTVDQGLFSNRRVLPHATRIQCAMLLLRKRQIYRRFHQTPTESRTRCRHTPLRWESTLF
jgi:hypothetical protein